MKRINSLRLLTAAFTLGVLSFAVQAERIDHFKGKEAETLNEAYENLETGNRKLQKLMEGELTAETMAEIHQLTYTLENALQKIDSDIDRIAASLEAVHLATERNNTAVAREQGKRYLDLSREIVRKP
ncbi:MAG: DUF6746 family protein [Pseudomonadota bacterium]